VPEPVVLSPLLGVGEHLVRLGDLAEPALRLLLVPLVGVGVVLLGQAAEGTLDLVG